MNYSNLTSDEEKILDDVIKNLNEAKKYLENRDVNNGRKYIDLAKEKLIMLNAVVDERMSKTLLFPQTQDTTLIFIILGILLLAIFVLIALELKGKKRG